jgi:hypothetical protein
LESELKVMASQITSKVSQYDYDIAKQQMQNDIDGKVSPAQMSTQITQNAQAVVTAVNSTDGIGRVKTTKVTIDNAGLTVDNGAIIVRDANSKAIMTSQGLKMKYIFVSQGKFDGWAISGMAADELNDEYATTQVMLYVYLPQDLTITSATLHTKSMPFYLTNQSGINGAPNGYYHPQRLRIYRVLDNLDMSIWVDGYEMVDTPYVGENKENLAPQVWGGEWTPTGNKIQIKDGNMTQILRPGQRDVYMVTSHISPTRENTRYQGLMQMELEVEGFLRG